MMPKRPMGQLLIFAFIFIAGGSSAWGNENWFATGVRHLKAQSFEPAIQAFSRALETLSDDYEAYNNRGVAYSQLGRLDEALADFNRALRIKPDYGAALLNRGISYRRKGHISAAIQDYGTLIKITPDYTKAHQNLSWILATCPDPRFRDGPLALSLIRMAAHSNPQAKMADNWAAAWAEQGDFTRAAQIQQKLVDQLGATAAPAVLAEERYWLTHYGKDQARRDSYLVRDTDEEAAVARRLLARLVQNETKAATAKQVPPPEAKPLAKPKKTPSAVAAQGRYGVQVGSYSRFANARDAVETLRTRNHPAHAFKVVLADGRTWYRVLVGQYGTVSAAQAAVQTLQAQNYSDAFEVPARYRLTLQGPAQSSDLPAQIQEQLLALGFYPYQGTDGQWFLGAYRGSAQARAREQELAGAGISVQVVRF